MFHMFFLGVGVTIVAAVAVGYTWRAATQADRAYQETKARVPVLKEVRSGATHRAFFWFVVAILVAAVVVDAHLDG